MICPQSAACSSCGFPVGMRLVMAVLAVPWISRICKGPRVRRSVGVGGPGREYEDPGGLSLGKSGAGGHWRVFVSFATALRSVSLRFWWTNEDSNLDMRIMRPQY